LGKKRPIELQCVLVQPPKPQHKSAAPTDPASGAGAPDMPPTGQEQEFREAWRAVANAKLNEYRRQCWRLAGLVRAGAVIKQAAVDHLVTIAIAHALFRSLGEDRIEAIIAEAFADTEFGSLRAEAV
jgi:hypothetical protein